MGMVYDCAKVGEWNAQNRRQDGGRDEKENERMDKVRTPQGIPTQSHHQHVLLKSGLKSGTQNDDR